MDAVDYYNSGLRKMRSQDFSGAETDFTCAISGDKSTAPDTKELEFMAYINRGITFYNRAIGGYKNSNENLMLTSSAIADWEWVLKFDSNPERKTKAQGLIEELKRNRGF
jgi:hypothetical protein